MFLGDLPDTAIVTDNRELPNKPDRQRLQIFLRYG